MRLMVIDPRGRLGRGRFVYDLVMPNIAAAIAILVLRIMDLAVVTDAAVGALAVLLLWSANFAAPIARLHDLGIAGWWHLLVAGLIFVLTTIGPVTGFGELVLRVADWIEVLRGHNSQVPSVDARSARIGGTLALVEVLALAFLPGQKGANRFGADPKVKA